MEIQTYFLHTVYVKIDTYYGLCVFASYSLAPKTLLHQV